MDRYQRHISLPGFGSEGQSRLGKSHVMVVGSGALGSISASYIAAAGVGHLTVCDFDTIDLTNLQRQLCYTESQVGGSKAQSLVEFIKERNTTIEVTCIERRVGREDALNLFAQSDFVIEGSDNPDTKYMVAEVCEQLGIPYCIAGVYRYSGQVLTHTPGTARYNDIFPRDKKEYDPAVVGAEGVLGPLPGIVGSIQASEAIKVLTDCGEPLTDKVLCIDLQRNLWQVVSVNSA